MFSAHGDMPLSNWELKDSEATFGDAEPAWCVGCPSSPPPPHPATMPASASATVSGRAALPHRVSFHVLLHCCLRE